MIKSNKGILVFIFLVVLIDVTGLSILLPVNAFIVREYNTDALSVTMLTVIYALAQFFAAPILGKLSDHFGRRPVLLISIFGSAVGYIIFGIGGSLWVLFFSRFIDGITGGNILVANAYIADITPPESRAKNYGIVGAAFGFGFLIGPVLSGLLCNISLSAPAYAAAILSFFNFLVGLFILPESLSKANRKYLKINIRNINPFSEIFKFMHRFPLYILLIVYTIFQFAFNGNITIFSVFALNKYNIDPLDLAALFTVSGIGSILMQGFLIDRFVKHFGEVKLLRFSLFSLPFIYFATFIVPYFWMQYPLIIIGTAFTGILWPTVTALATKEVSEQEQGSLAGAITALSSLMSIIGPFCAGILYDHLSISSPFILFAGMLLMGYILFRLNFKLSFN